MSVSMRSVVLMVTAGVVVVMQSVMESVAGSYFSTCLGSLGVL